MSETGVRETGFSETFVRVHVHTSLVLFVKDYKQSLFDGYFVINQVYSISDTVIKLYGVYTTTLHYLFHVLNTFYYTIS